VLSEVVDVHAHGAPTETIERMRQVAPGAVPNIDTDGSMVFFRYPSGVVNGPVPRGIVDVDARIADMDIVGVDYQVVSPRPQFFSYEVPGEVATELASLTNEGLAAMAASHPERLGVMMTLPMQAPEAAVAEIERFGSNRQIRGALVDSNIGGISLADERFAPVWAALERADLPVLIHPYQADVVGKDRLGSHYLFNLIGNPVDSTIAIGDVVFGGLLDKFPGLRWGFVHGGGVAPYLLGRWDHGWHMREVTRQLIPDALPSELLRRCWFDTVTHSGTALEFLGATVGWDRIVLGTDYPFDMGVTDPVGFVDSAVADPDVRSAIAGTNQRAFLRVR
jgi:aminocarboxymuconate-semialdehyde decarboxylase